MRETSIISIIRKYGLNSKKISDDYHVKYQDALKLIQDVGNGKLRVISAIDNVLDPSKSTSHICEVPSCHKRIRFEYLLKDSKTNKNMTVGLNCACALLGLSKLDTKKLRTMNEVLKNQSELDEWKKTCPNEYKKLEAIGKLNLEHFKPFCNEIKYTALNKEDTEYIKSVNYKLVLINAKYIDILKELKKYEPKNKFYKSVYERIAYQNIYISKKQMEAINKAYDEYLKKKDNVLVQINNGYNVKDKLKENEYKFNPNSKQWYKTINKAKKDDEIKFLKTIGVESEDINVRD